MPIRRISALALLGFAALATTVLPDEPASAPQLQDLKLGGQESQVAWNMFWYGVCGRALPDFARRSASVYKGWRERNREVIARLEAMPDFKPAMERSLSARVEGTAPGDRASMVQQCTMMTVMVWEPPPVLGKTPSETWSGLVEALRRGDASRTLGYFLLQFRLSASPRLSQLGPAGMKSIAGRIRSFRIEEEGPETAAGRMTTSDGREEAIHFDHYSGDAKDASTAGWLIERLDELWADCGQPPRVPGTGECEGAAAK